MSFFAFNKYILHLAVGCLVMGMFWLGACTPQNENISTDSSLKLEFSRDTVYFDTVFTDMKTITKRLTVYNRHKKAVEVSSIYIKNNPQKPFSLIINGKSQNSAENLMIRGGDSLKILAVATIDDADQNLPFLIEDEIVFVTNGNTQSVKLMAWGQDAHFYGEDNAIICDETWQANRPYIVLGQGVLVDSLCTLTIEEGTRIHFASGAYLIVKGTLIIKGSAEKNVVLEGIRQEEEYKTQPGQWGGVYFDRGSTGNTISFATIKNALVGIQSSAEDIVPSIPEIMLQNSRIENIASTGIFALNGDMQIINTVVNNCLNQTFACWGGGSYVLVNNTFANYGTTFFRKEPQFVISNEFIIKDDNISIIKNLSLQMANNIVWGSMKEELFVKKNAGAAFVLGAEHNLFRTEITSFDANNNIINKDPKFKDIEKQDFSLKEQSPAQNKGIYLGVDTDITGKKRDEQPDMGAYEF